MPYACPCPAARAYDRPVVAGRRGFGHQPLVAQGRGEPVKRLASSKKLSCLPPGQLLIDALQAPLHRESEVESRRSTMPARAVKLRAAG